MPTERTTADIRPFHGSLRGRLLRWYSSMLALVMVTTGAMACYLTWRARVAGVDRDLQAYAATLSAAVRPAEAGTFDLVLPPATPGANVPDHVIWTPSGEVIDRSRSGIEPSALSSPGSRTRDGRRDLTVTSESGAMILVTQSLAPIEADIRALAGQIAILAGSALVASLAIGWWIVGRALTPIDRISTTAKRMAAGDFAARIAVDRVESELGALARVLNDAFDHLHGSLERQRRFTADASHELRTPIATLSAEAEWALSRDRRPDEYRGSLDTLRRTADRMRRIVERLLTLARMDAGVTAPPTSVDLKPLVEQVVSDLHPLASARGLHVELDTVPMTVWGDHDSLVDAVTNVVTNAIQYNVDGGAVRIRVEGAGDRATLTIADTGIGIAADDLSRVFEPFFRADRSRRRDRGGAGLGLAVTHAVVRQYGGDTRCESTPGQGTRVTITLRTVPGSVRGAPTSETSPPTFVESRR